MFTITNWALPEPKPTLQADWPCVTLARMRNLKRIVPLLLVPSLLVGCTTPVITNLTPSRQVRKENAQYPFEVQWNSRKQNLVKDSMKAYVVIGLEQYPMQRVALLTNRFETLVPIPKDKPVVTYQYKFDYECLGFGTRLPDSKTSKYYQLYVVDY